MGTSRKLPPQQRTVLANGKRPCRGCGGEVPKGRRTWCSSPCRDEHYLALSFWARRRVYERDKGICARCGADTDFLRRIAWKLRRREEADGMKALKAAWGIIEVRPWSTWEVPTMWEADHAVPLSEGGANTLENYRTLCVPCHRTVTRELRARLGKRSRQLVLAKERPEPGDPKEAGK